MLWVLDNYKILESRLNKVTQDSILQVIFTLEIRVEPKFLQLKRIKGYFGN